jgi:hypothetical protein
MNASSGIESTGPTPTPRRWWLLLPILLTLATGAWLGLKYSATGKRAELATGYIAHVVCSCRYVGNRDMASCKTDFEPGTEIVDVKDDTGKRRITASIPLLSKRSATFDPEYGCALDNP